MRLEGIARHLRWRQRVYGWGGAQLGGDLPQLDILSRYGIIVLHLVFG